MSQTLNMSNFDEQNIIEVSQLNADVAVGDLSVEVHFTDNLDNGDFVYLSRLGSESGEVVTVDSVTDADTFTIFTAATKAHSRFDEVTVLFGDQLKVYRAANVDGTAPDSADFSFLDTVNIDYDQMMTSYVDSVGDGSLYWYKYIYRNSSTGEESNLDDSATVRGGAVGNYASVESIRREAGFENNRNITDAMIDEKRQAAQREIDSTLRGMYTLPFTQPINPLISEITRKIAAGLLLLNDYGTVTSNSTNDGQKKLDEGRALLAKLNTKELVLTDETGSDTSISGTGNSFGGWPDETTQYADPEDGGSTRLFRISDRF